jgi:serine/threonine protein kinase
MTIVGISIVALVVCLVGCQRCLALKNEGEDGGLSSKLLSKEDLKAAKAVAATKSRFGQLNADGIIIPFQYLVFKKHIASGSFGRVIEGSLQGIDGKVAIKELNDTVPIAALKNEVSLLAHLQHPHIMTFHGLASSSATRNTFQSEQWYIVSEYCPATLEQIFVLTTFTASDFVTFASQICDAFHFLHLVKHIAHRDLKPSNLLVTSTGVLKVADLGLAKTCQGNMAHTAELGTASFMAPELMDGHNVSIDPFAADRYALGLVFWCMWTCKRDPFSKLANFAQVVNAVSAGERPEFEESHLKQIPDTFHALIQQLWGEDTAARPSLESVLAIIEAVSFDANPSSIVLNGSTANDTVEAGRKGSGPEMLPRAQVLGEDVSWREQWDGSVGQKLVFNSPVMGM